MLILNGDRVSFKFKGQLNSGVVHSQDAKYLYLDDGRDVEKSLILTVLPAENARQIENNITREEINPNIHHDLKEVSIHIFTKQELVFSTRDIEAGEYIVCSVYEESLTDPLNVAVQSNFEISKNDLFIINQPSAGPTIIDLNIGVGFGITVQHPILRPLESGVSRKSQEAEELYRKVLLNVNSLASEYTLKNALELQANGDYLGALRFGYRAMYHSFLVVYSFSTTDHRNLSKSLSNLLRKVMNDYLDYLEELIVLEEICQKVDDLLVEVALEEVVLVSSTTQAILGLVSKGIDILYTPILDKLSTLEVSATITPDIDK